MNLEKFNNMIELDVCLLIFAAMVTLVLLIGAATDHARNKPFLKWFTALLVTAFIMLLGEAGLWYFLGDANHIGLLKFCAFLSFGFGAVLNAIYACCLVSFIKERAQESWTGAVIVSAACAVVLLLVFVSMFNGMLFSIDENGMYHDGYAYFLVDAVDIFSLIMLMLMIIYYSRHLGTKGTLTLLSFVAFPAVAMFALPYWNPTPLYLATTLSLIFIYLFFHVDMTRQLAENEIKLAEKEKELAESRISIMLSQLQPHFMYNMLNSIYYLCGSNPGTARAAIDKFADYLRNNMESIQRVELIPFEKEYEHIQTYLDLEKIRFGEDLKIVCQMEAMNFKLPPLTVQPLVENAVKHGATKKRGGGTVTIATRETAEAWIVTISDTGRGFDPENCENDGKLHVGIRNVRERLEALVGGTLEISSETGIGTEAVVTIPKKEGGR